MKYIELARLLTNKSLEDCINWKCPYQMILEDEQDFCTDCNLECEDCWNKEVPSELPIVALFEANKGEAVHSSPNNTKSKIQAISEHYSKENQLNKCKEELHELLAELEHVEVINGKVSLSGNTWAECADAIIMIAQIIMQHGKEEAVKAQMEYKLDRQLKRMAYEDN